MRDEKVRRQNLGDHRASDGQGGQPRSAAAPLRLQPRIGDRDEDDVPLPARPRPAFEVIEPEFVLELLILLLDRPPLVSQVDQALQ